MLTAIRVRKKELLLGVVSVLLVSVILGFSILITANAQDYNETNPDLTFALINSDCETSYGVAAYTPTGNFNQSSGTYEMTTNAYVAWRTTDDIGYAYKRYDIGGKSDDIMTFSTTLTSMEPAEKVNDKGELVSLYSAASAGIMIRGGLAADEPEVFLHCREGVVTIVYRAQKGDNTLVQYSTFAPQYPVNLKIDKKGTQYTCSFKNANSDTWISMRPVGSNIQGPIYAGLSAHSCDPNIQIRAKFSGYTAVGSGALSIDPDTSSSQTSSQTEAQYEDAPVGNNVLLCETFSDGSMTNEPASVINPVWVNPSDQNIVKQPDGNKIWNKNFATSADYIGNEKWTDYSTSLNIQFTKNCDPDINNIFRLSVRHRAVDPYGYYDYGIQCENGNQITIYKRVRDNQAIDDVGTKLISTTLSNSYLGDGIWHKLQVDTIDNKITVYWDGIAVIKYEDTSKAMPNLKGNIGIITKNTDVYLDNITVTKIDDPLGGDYDNTIGGNYDQQIPDYVQDWASKGRSY